MMIYSLGPILTFICDFINYREPCIGYQPEATKARTISIDFIMKAQLLLLGSPHQRLCLPAIATGHTTT